MEFGTGVVKVTPAHAQMIMRLERDTT